MQLNCMTLSGSVPEIFVIALKPNTFLKAEIKIFSDQRYAPSLLKELSYFFVIPYLLSDGERNRCLMFTVLPT